MANKALKAINPFTRYPLDPAAHPDRPWWRAQDPNTAMRSDGIYLSRELNFDGNQIVETPEGIPEPNNPIPEGERLVLRRVTGTDETGAPIVEVLIDKTFKAGAVAEADFAAVLVEADQKWPIPAPMPAASQVWYWTDRRSAATLLGHIDEAGGKYKLHWSFTVVGRGESPYLPGEWPPKGAVLVAGPGSPWKGT